MVAFLALTGCFNKPDACATDQMWDGEQCVPAETGGETGDTNVDETDTGETEETDTAETETAETDTAETETAETDTSETDTSETDTSETDTAPEDDRDGDGYSRDEGDCDDLDPERHPGQEDDCDEIDDDCDGAVDEDAPATSYHPDADGDGYGDADTFVSACDGTGLTKDGSDCDDTDADVNPGADERCDGVDNDCDDDVDVDAIDELVMYLDMDGDGYGAGEGMSGCTFPSSYSPVDGDCDDSDADYHPGATEACDDPADYNCDGSTEYADIDGDLVAACEDCDDTSAAVYAGAPEVCDGLDNDCDGSTDAADAEGALSWYADADGDSYGDPAVEVVQCDAPVGYVGDASDCDDTCVVCHPGGAEVCDGGDNDCDGTVDSGASDADTWYPDTDGDTWGDTSAAYQACTAGPMDVSVGGDCDDGAAESYPGARERCDDADNDCDTLVDEEAVDASTWYRDQDGDGWGNPSATRASCDPISGYASQVGDCEDSDAAVNPDATESCDGVDNDCSGAVDDGATDAVARYVDADGDDHGVGTSVVTCPDTAGYADVNDDCDDTSAAVHPGADEACDQVDNDCDSDVDEGWRACFDTGYTTAWLAGDAEVAADGAFVDGHFGVEYTATGALPDIASLCAILGDWREYGTVATPCPSCDWSFSLGVSGTYASGTHCDDFGLEDETGFDGWVASWGFAEAYDFSYDGETFPLTNVVFFYSRVYGWFPFSYNYGSSQYNTGDATSMSFRSFVGTYEYYYPYPE